MWKSLRQYTKQWIAYSITVALYLVSVYFVFYKAQLVEWSFAIVALLFSIHFAVISAKHYKLYVKKLNRAALLIVSSVIIALTTDYNQILIILSYVIFHIGLYLYIVGKRGFINNSISPHPWYFSNAGMYMFTLFCTVSYSIIMIGILGRIPFDCVTIEDSYDRIWSFISTPLEKGIANIQDFVKKNPDTIIESSDLPAWFLDEFMSLDAWDTFINERTKINNNICNTLFDNIQSQFQKPWFQVAILLPLFLVLSPIIRLILYVVSTVTMITIQLFIKLKIYRKHKVTKIVDEWY